MGDNCDLIGGGSGGGGGGSEIDAEDNSRRVNGGEIVDDGEVVVATSKFDSNLCGDVAADKFRSISLDVGDIRADIFPDDGGVENANEGGGVSESSVVLSSPIDDLEVGDVYTFAEVPVRIAEGGV